MPKENGKLEQVTTMKYVIKVESITQKDGSVFYTYFHVLTHPGKHLNI